jgi:hypothetical protein
LVGYCNANAKKPTLIVAAAGNSGPKTSSEYAVLLPGAGVVLATDINTQKTAYNSTRAAAE